MHQPLDFEDSLISGILKESDSEIDSNELPDNQYQLEMILRETDVLSLFFLGSI